MSRVHAASSRITSKHAGIRWLHGRRLRVRRDFLRSKSLRDSACVVADVRLPQMDGLELQRRLKTERPGVHVILITAYQDESSRRLGLEQGAVCFLYKPFNPEELLAAVDRALNESQKNR